MTLPASNAGSTSEVHDGAVIGMVLTAPCWATAHATERSDARPIIGIGDNGVDAVSAAVLSTGGRLLRFPAAKRGTYGHQRNALQLGNKTLNHKGTTEVTDVTDGHAAVLLKKRSWKKVFGRYAEKVPLCMIPRGV